MTKKFDLLIFIGRFQPFHIEHKRVIDIALEQAENVLVLVGSAGKARSIRNPFTFDERQAMIAGSYSAEDAARLIIKPLYDKMYNDAAWIAQVQDTVKSAVLHSVNRGGFPVLGTADAHVGLIGMEKDHTSYYLKMFPQFDSVGVQLTNPLHATYIRERFLDGTAQRHEETNLPTNVINFLFDQFKPTETYDQLQRELQFVRNYKKQWEAAPYPVKHVTVDAVVEQSGHVLLIRRRSEPGKNLCALPGGHLEVDERVTDGAIRELREETKIKVPDPVLRGSVVNAHLFDDPHRSTIGRVITYAQHIKLPNDSKLPKVKGSDDANKAFWVPIADLKEENFFDDHYHIIQYFLGI